MSPTEPQPSAPQPSETPPTGAAPPERPSRGRSVAAVICLVLAALLTTPAAVAYWGQRTLNDATRYVDTVGPLVDSPEVQDVLATKVTTAIQQQVDVEAILNQVFAGVITDRPRLQLLVGPLTAAINGLVEREVREFIASPEFADLWVRINTRAQQALQRVLTGDQSGAVSLQGDEIVLDVDEVISQVKERLVARGLTIVENVPIPETDRQIVLMEAPRVRQMRTIYAFSNPVAKWALPLVGVLFAGGAPAGSPTRPDGRVDRRARGRQRPPARLCALGRTAAVHRRARGYDVRAGKQGLLQHPAHLPRARPGSRVVARSDHRRRRCVRRREPRGHRGPHNRVRRSGADRRQAGRHRTRRDRRGRPLGGVERRDGCGWSSSPWVRSSCSGATTSPRTGCGGRWRWWWSSWRSCRSWSGRAGTGCRQDAWILVWRRRSWLAQDCAWSRQRRRATTSSWICATSSWARPDCFRGTLIA